MRWSLATLLLGFAIWKQGGNAALWEWAYVNHVKRLLSPGATGHRQPLLYYAWTLPYAMLPWLAPLIESLRPSHWRRLTLAGLPRLSDPARYGALMSAAMLLLLSLSATKRETYLLPLLPLLFLWLGIRTCEWWQQWQVRDDSWLGALWWLQVLLLCLMTLAAPVGAWIWLGHPAGGVLLTLLIALAAVCPLVYFSATAQRLRAGPAALACAIAGGAVVLLLAPLLLNELKDMGPFVRRIGAQLPPGEPVCATGVDETLAAEIPFYTGRSVVPMSIDQLRGPAASAHPPEWVLVQDNSGAGAHGGNEASLEPGYALVDERAFGAQRRLLLWHRRSPAP